MDANKQELQQKVMELEKMRQQANAAQQEIMRLENAALEIDETKEAVSDLKNIEKGSEILVSLGAGFYAFAKIKDTDKVVTNMGGLLGNQKAEISTKFLDEQLKIIQESKTDLDNQLNEVAQKMQLLRMELEGFQ